MSTDESDSITSSQIRRFGLYRTIDAKTEEFLRLSRKRQMRQGCACAAISTTITVTVVVIVLVIYEYMIAVETSFVQQKRSFNKTKYLNKDLPIADRLDRNFFGFDQDYYERMPLLINALQDISHTDSETRIRSQRKKQFFKSYTIKPRSTTVLNRFIRKTSPKPFILEYRSPYPMPFSKFNTIPSNWMEQYRNAQRLKNLHDVVKYLEKTLNAKFGDIYLPTRAQIELSEMYVGPAQTKETNFKQKTVHNSPQSNHYTDPLHIYRPNDPGEVNLLADGFRFAPTFVSKYNEQNTDIKYPDSSKQSCVGTKCLNFNKNIPKSADLSSDEEIMSSTSTKLNNNKLKSLVMFNLLPINKSNSHETRYKNEIDQIYITTSKPVFQFKRKTPLRRISYRRKKRPTSFKDRNKNNFISQVNGEKNMTTQYFNHHTKFENNNEAININEPSKNYFDDATISNVEATSLYSHTINYPKVNYSDIEDYHMGSSGVIPIEYGGPQIYPVVTPIIPLSELIMSTTERITTIPPDIIQFSPEDAKVPDHYYNIRKSDIDEVTESEVNDWNYSERTLISNDEFEPNTLIVKLRNIIEATSKENTADEASTTESSETTPEENIYTTIETYVPQINGHYRDVKHKNLISLLQESSEKYRKKRIEFLTTRNPTYVPMYVEIKRNRNITASNQN
ncbi:uncharacterized protein LOC124530748 [Vanessa cardui]|uniref:uncharacterized protein LOC124530748 n=1 Tax=Vanessa cardui TaxID=171605 RepID=UPI001F132122|nr:uncharacterized protein LOC124530748 [Vanessa cardui]